MPQGIPTTDLDGVAFGFSTRRMGWDTTKACVIQEPTYATPASAINEADFDWFDINTATQLVDMVKQRCRAATGIDPDVLDPTTGAGAENASLASTWAKLQAAIVAAVDNVVAPANNSSATDYASWGDLAAEGTESAFELFCKSAGLESAGAWGWAYAVAVDPAGDPISIRPSSPRTCTTNDHYAVKAMITDIKLALAAMQFVKWNIPGKAGRNFEWIASGPNATDGAYYSGRLTAPSPRSTPTPESARRESPRTASMPPARRERPF
jgi:hypothetical protein